MQKVLWITNAKFPAWMPEAKWFVFQPLRAVSTLKTAQKQINVGCISPVMKMPTNSCWQKKPRYYPSYWFSIYVNKREMVL